MKFTIALLPLAFAVLAMADEHCPSGNCPVSVKDVTQTTETQIITRTADGVTVTKSFILPQTVVVTPTVTVTGTSVVQVSVVTETPTVTETATMSTAVTQQASAVTVSEVTQVTQTAEAEHVKDKDHDKVSGAGSTKVGAAALVAVGGAFVAFM